MRILKLAVVVTVVFSFVGCLGPAPLHGLFFSDVHYPSYYDGASTQGRGSKSGAASMTSYLGLVATGDAGITAACDNGGITSIKTVDHHFKSILGIIQMWTTEVTGE